MMNLIDAQKLITGLESFIETLKSENYPNFSDIELISEINENLSFDIEILLDFLSNKEISFDVVDDSQNDEVTGILTTISSPEEDSFSAPETCVMHGFWDEMDPDADWRLIYDMNIMVSDSGMFVSLDDQKVLKKYFIDGDMRVAMSDDVKDVRRAAPLVCRAFGIRSNDTKGDFIVDFKDGDRRNLSPNNIYWVKSSDVEKRTDTILLMEDICRRILEFRGDIDKILPLYENSRPAVTQQLINGVISGQIYKNISQKFFIVSDGKVFPKPDMTPKNSSFDGVDVAGFLKISGDKELVKELLKDKIGRKQTLSIPDKKVLVFFAIDSMGVRKNDPDIRKVQNVVKNNYGIDVDESFITECVNDYTSELAISFGRVKVEETNNE